MSELIFKNGNIFDTECESIVCPVNCYGVLGAGVAKLFRDKKEFADQNAAYKNACNTGVMAPGSVIIGGPKVQPPTKQAIYLATKMDWRDDSKLEWVEFGLLNLLKTIKTYRIKSIAMPALGAGNGKLPWPSVELIIKAIFENDGQDDKIVEVYLPHVGS